MPCYKDLALVPLDAGFVRGSILARSGRGPRCPPDVRTWQPEHVVALARASEIRHAETLRGAAERHLQRTATAPKLRCQAEMEESSFLRKLGAEAPSRMTLGLRQLIARDGVAATTAVNSLTPLVCISVPMRFGQRGACQRVCAGSSASGLLPALPGMVQPCALVKQADGRYGLQPALKGTEDLVNSASARWPPPSQATVESEVWEGTSGTSSPSMRRPWLKLLFLR
ncbi:unnamed protein product [Symbiodinium microadriaticum]|nr:unnamed protein product [Symbiodinium microadriaticum]